MLFVGVEVYHGAAVALESSVTVKVLSCFVRTSLAHALQEVDPHLTESVSKRQIPSIDS